MLTRYSTALLTSLLLNSASIQADQTLLSSVINSDHRSTENKQRDQYRHPQKTLEFFGITPAMSVVEVWPGKGWYSEILAPYLRQEGSFIAAGFPKNEGPKWRQNIYKAYQQWLEASPEHYDQVQISELGPPSNGRLAQTTVLMPY